MNHRPTFTVLNSTSVPCDGPQRTFAGTSTGIQERAKPVERALKPSPTRLGPQPRFIVLEVPPQPHAGHRLRYSLISPGTSLLGMLGVTTAIVSAMSYAGLL